jgi:hypothetical protein
VGLRSEDGFVRKKRGDGGWSFFAGDEDPDYMDNPGNFNVWHVNEIANLDPAIVPYLYALPGQTFDRDGDRFVEAPTSKPDASRAKMPPGVQVVRFNSNGDAIAKRASALRETASPNATDVRVGERDGVLQLTYRLRDDTTDTKVPSLYAFVVGHGGHVQCGIYADREIDATAAYAIVQTLRSRQTE